MGPIRGAPLKLHPPNKNKCIEAKTAELNKKIRRARHKKNKEQLIAKREALKTKDYSAELNWKPEFRLIDGAFDGAYRRYRIDGRSRMDVETFFDRIRRALINLIRPGPKRLRGLGLLGKTRMDRKGLS